MPEMHEFSRLLRHAATAFDALVSNLVIDSVIKTPRYGGNRMGRISSTGIKFMTSRDGLWIYHRAIRADLARHIEGSIKLSWRGKVASISGKKVIKIALGTDDRTEGAMRHAEVHAQIERLIAKAKLKALAEAPTAVEGRLSHEQIRAIGESIKHRDLAEDDFLSVDDGSGDDILLEDGTPTTWFDVLEQVEQGQLEKTRDALKNRDLSSLLDPQVLTDEDGESIEIEPPLDRELESVGIVLPPDHPDRRILALEILRAKSQVLDAKQKRRQGEVIPTPPKPVIEKPVMGLPISQAFQKFSIQRELRPNTRDDYENQVKRFVSLHGDLAVEIIDKSHLRAFGEMLRDHPRRLPKHLIGAPLPEIAQFGRDNPELPRLSPQTINDRSLGAIGAILGWAVENGIVDQNARSGVKLSMPKKRKGTKERVGYDDDDLKLIFSQPWFSGGKIPRGGGGKAAIWMPLIAAFSGARLTEICQLKTADIRSETAPSGRKITYFDFAEGEDKSLKNDGSERRVPIHPELIRLGLLDYVEDQRKKKIDRLFPEVSSKGPQLSSAWSKWFGKTMREAGITDTRKVFHSFRHRFKTQHRACHILEAVGDAITGHASETVGGDYGEVTLETKAEAMDLLIYPGLNLSHVKA
ncbi:MAG: site-specific integrase [Proteobacteria bacterium]|nr:site-specific integrase [Pseudomonadota bacterium]